jgi:hypothetical protein
VANSVKIKDKDRLVSRLNTEIQQAISYKEQYIESKVTQRQQQKTCDSKYYDKIQPYLSSKCSYISPDVYVAIERVKGSLMKIFFGAQDVVQVQGTMGNLDEQAAKDYQIITNHQIQISNKGFVKFLQWFDDALTNLAGFVKCYLYQRFEWHEMPFVDAQGMPIALSQMDIDRMIVESDKQLRVKKKIPAGQADMITGQEMYFVMFEKYTLTERYPCIELVPPENILYTPSAKSLSGAPFVATIMDMTVDELRRRAKNEGDTDEGIYDKSVVELVAMEGEQPQLTYLEETIYPEREEELVLSGDKVDPNKVIRCYECYIKDDINGDGLLEDLVVTISGSHVLRCDENTYGRNPIFKVSPNIQSHKIWPDSGMSDFAGKEQDVTTAVRRSWLINMGYNTDPQYAYNSAMINDASQLTDGKTKYVEVIGTEDVHKAIMPIPLLPFDPSAGAQLELSQQNLERITAVTRINQGVGGEAQGLNKTATGMQLTVGLSNQQIEQIARTFAEAEDGVADLFRFMVEMNLKYPPPEQEVLDVLGHPLPPTQGKFRYVVDPTLGTGVKSQQMQNFQIILADVPFLMQIGLMTPKEVYELKKKQYEVLGEKDGGKYLVPPQPQGVMNGQTGIGTDAAFGNGEGVPGLPGKNILGVQGGVAGIGGTSGGGQALGSANETSMFT